MQPKPRFVQRHDVVFFLIVTLFTFVFLYLVRGHQIGIIPIIVTSLVAGLGQTLIFKMISRGRTPRK